MQLDQAHIAIHERGWLDNLDLALHVMRAHGWGILLSALVGILPLALVNDVLVDWGSAERVPDRATSLAYVATIVLVMLEAPLATAPLTLYLGQALFVEKPSGRQMARDFVQCLPQLLLLQIFLRGLLAIPIVTWIVPYVVWPYLNEVILLERNPLVGRGAQLSTMKRSASLHRGNSGDFVLRAAGTLCLAALLIFALRGAAFFLCRNVFGFEPGWLAEGIFAQVVLWSVVVYFTVARFLAYLDQRIRNEGWEVELLLRAQRERLAKQIV